MLVDVAPATVARNDHGERDRRLSGRNLRQRQVVEPLAGRHGEADHRDKHRHEGAGSIAPGRHRGPLGTCDLLDPWHARGLVSVRDPEPARHVRHRPIAEAARRQAAGRRARAKRQARIERRRRIDHQRTGDRGVRRLRGGAIGEDAAGTDPGQNRPAILGKAKLALKLLAQLLDVRVEIVTVLVAAVGERLKVALQIDPDHGDITRCHVGGSSPHPFVPTIPVGEEEDQLFRRLLALEQTHVAQPCTGFDHAWYGRCIGGQEWDRAAEEQRQGETGPGPLKSKHHETPLMHPPRGHTARSSARVGDDDPVGVTLVGKKGGARPADFNVACPGPLTLRRAARSVPCRSPTG